MEPFDRVGGANAFPLVAGQLGEGKEPIAGLVEAVGYRLAFEPPFAKEGPAALFDLGRRGGVEPSLRPATAAHADSV